MVEKYALFSCILAQVKQLLGGSGTQLGGSSLILVWHAVGTRHVPSIDWSVKSELQKCST
jgi:hypothetical protein